MFICVKGKKPPSNFCNDQRKKKYDNNLDTYPVNILCHGLATVTTTDNHHCCINVFGEKYQGKNINLSGNMIKNKWNKPTHRFSRYYYSILLLLNTNTGKERLLNCKWTSHRNRFCSKMTWSLENKNFTRSLSLSPKYRIYFDSPRPVHLTDIGCTARVRAYFRRLLDIWRKP